MTNLIQNTDTKSSSIAESIDAFINAPNARNPAVYKIIGWDVNGDSWEGSLFASCQRAVAGLDVEHRIAFSGLFALPPGNIENAFRTEVPLIVKKADRNTFKLLREDGSLLFEGCAIAAETRVFGFAGVDPPKDC